MNPPLLIRPLPHNGQSPRCYVNQLAVANGYTSAKKMFSTVCGLDLGDDKDYSLNEIQALTGHELTHLNDLPAYVDDKSFSPYFQFTHASLPSYHMRKGNWGCMQCFAKNRFIKAEWRIGWLPICLDHECLLVPLDHVTFRALYFSDTKHNLTHAANDAIYDHQIIEYQKTLARSFATDNGQRMVDLIDGYLRRCLTKEQLQKVDKRQQFTSMKYWPFNVQNTWKIMDCLATQLGEISWDGYEPIGISKAAA